MAQQKAFKKVFATFQPQEWVGSRKDQAMEAGPAFDIDVTYPLVNMPLEKLQHLTDDSNESDHLVSGLHDHSGPFYVTVQDAAMDFFEVDRLSEITQEMLDEAKKKVARPAMTVGQYVNCAGSACPVCPSTDVKSTGMVETRGHLRRQSKHCKACGCKWIEEFTLTSYKLVD